MKKQLYLKTFGCQMNEYDSEKIEQLLDEQNGLTLTDSPEQADLIILNTCSIREKAEVKVYSDLGRWLHPHNCEFVHKPMDLSGRFCRERIDRMPRISTLRDFIVRDCSLTFTFKARDFAASLF